MADIISQVGDFFSSGVSGATNAISDFVGSGTTAATPDIANVAADATGAGAQGADLAASDAFNANLGSLAAEGLNSALGTGDTAGIPSATGTSSGPNLLSLSGPPTGGGGPGAAASAIPTQDLPTDPSGNPYGGGPNSVSSVPGSTGTPQAGPGTAAGLAPYATGNLVPTAATATGATAPSGGFLNQVGKFLGTNWKEALPLALGGGALLKNALTPVPGVKGLNSISSAEQGAGRGLINTVNTGKLPPGAEAGVQNWLDNTVGNLVSSYSSRGMGGSVQKMPDGSYRATGNTSLQEDVALANEQAQALRFQTAQQLSSLGLQELGGAAQSLGAAAQAQVQSDSELASAMAELGLAAGIGSNIKS